MAKNLRLLAGRSKLAHLSLPALDVKTVHEPIDLRIMSHLYEELLTPGLNTTVARPWLPDSWSPGCLRAVDIVGPKALLASAHADGRKLTSHLSPSAPVNLPRADRFLAKIPLNAVKFAFLYPSSDLAEPSPAPSAQLVLSPQAGAMEEGEATEMEEGEATDAIVGWAALDDTRLLLLRNGGFVYFDHKGAVGFHTRMLP